MPRRYFVSNLEVLPLGWNILCHVLAYSKNKFRQTLLSFLEFGSLLTGLPSSTLPQRCFWELRCSPLQKTVPNILEGLCKPFQTPAAAYFFMPFVITPFPLPAAFILSYFLILRYILHSVHAISSGILTLFCLRISSFSKVSIKFCRFPMQDRVVCSLSDVSTILLKILPLYLLSALNKGVLFSLFVCLNLTLFL